MADMEAQVGMHTVRAVQARVVCMRHGDKFIRGSVDSYNLGYGNTRLEIGSWSECLRCNGDDTFLHLEIKVTEEDRVPLDPATLREAMLEDMRNATGNDDSEA